jgi:RimJ/RimL family protein N-acetyltransferase
MVKKLNKSQISLLYTTRLILREPLLTDLNAVFAIHTNQGANKYNPKGLHQNIDQSRWMLTEWLSHWKIYQFGYWTVAERNAPEQIIGFGGLRYKNIFGKSRPNLYFCFQPDFWGHGYATEMARAACSVGFDTLRLPQIVATVPPDNLPSIRVLERLGMIHQMDFTEDTGISRYYLLDRPEYH